MSIVASMVRSRADHRRGLFPQRAPAQSDCACRRRLVKGEQQVAAPELTGPVPSSLSWSLPPSYHDCWWIFLFFCLFSLFWFPLPRHSDRLFARGQREARRREQGGRVRGGMDSGSAVRAKLVRAVCGGLLESGVRLPMLRRLARHAQRECFCAPTCSDAARARAGRYVAQAKRTPSRLCVQ